MEVVVWSAIIMISPYTSLHLLKVAFLPSHVILLIGAVFWFFGEVLEKIDRKSGQSSKITFLKELKDTAIIVFLEVMAMSSIFYLFFIFLLLKVLTAISSAIGVSLPVLLFLVYRKIAKGHNEVHKIWKYKA